MVAIDVDDARASVRQRRGETPATLKAVNDLVVEAP
jgi:hypothetical protein